LNDPTVILKNARENKGLTQTQIAEFIGVGLRMYQKIEDGQFPKYKTEQIKKIDNILNTNLYELIYEHTETLPSGNTVEILKPTEQKSYIEKRREIKNNKEDATIQFYEVGAAAGTKQNAEIIPVQKRDALHIKDLFKGSEYAIRISGNSMTPNYPSGAIIGIREIEDKQITPGSVYVIEKKNDLYIKRLFYKDDDQETGILQCVSDNALRHESGAREGKLFYPAFDIKIDDIRRLFKVTGIYKPNELMVID
jgi:phage repressor protein C with HTH and peptisase S24 domain